MSAHVRELVTRLLDQRVEHAHRVSGGDINETYVLTLAGNTRVFVKTRRDAPAGMYAREAEGLRYLAETRALRVPEVVLHTDELLVLEYLSPARRVADFDERLGRGLGALHRFGAPGFGLWSDNFIGPLPQANAKLDSWSDFYAQRRLLPLVERASNAGHVDAGLRARFDALLARVSELVGDEEPPARLHGDLWSGNVHSDETGAPVLIDPAVYGGHREIDLAMLQLFGAPSKRFFAAYDESCPRCPGHERRVALYQLYPLLVHVCLFGRAYVGQLSSALRKYE